MASFFKLILHGFLYAIGLPFFIIALAIYSLYCFAMFMFEAIRSIFVFFKGGTPFGDLKEDAEAKKILLERQNAPQENGSQPQPQNIYIFNQHNPNDQVAPAELNNQPKQVGEFDFTEEIKKINGEGGNF